MTCCMKQRLVESDKSYLILSFKYTLHPLIGSLCYNNDLLFTNEVSQPHDDAQGNNRNWTSKQRIDV